MYALEMFSTCAGVTDDPKGDTSTSTQRESPMKGKAPKASARRPRGPVPGEPRPTRGVTGTRYRWR